MSLWSEWSADAAVVVVGRWSAWSPDASIAIEATPVVTVVNGSASLSGAATIALQSVYIAAGEVSANGDSFVTIAVEAPAHIPTITTWFEERVVELSAQERVPVLSAADTQSVLVTIEESYVPKASSARDVAVVSI